jgi:hypothetical protein
MVRSVWHMTRYKLRAASHPTKLLSAVTFVSGEVRESSHKRNGCQTHLKGGSVFILSLTRMFLRNSQPVAHEVAPLVLLKAS